MSEQQNAMAKLTYNPADPLIHPINRPTKATISVALLSAKEHVSVPVFLQSGNNIHRYMLMKAMVINPDTNKAQRHLQHIWLLMNAETKPTVGQNGVFYVGNQNIGMLQDFEASMVGENGEMKTPKYNFAIVSGSMIPFSATPNKLFGNEWFTKIREPFCDKQNKALIGEETDGVFQRLMPGTEPYQKFMEKGCADTDRMFRAMLARGQVEKNMVFYVDDNGFNPVAAPYYNSGGAHSLYNAEKTGVRYPVFVNSASGVIAIDASINTTSTGNQSIVLQHGLRVLQENRANAKYSFDRVGTTYDRRKQAVPARLSAIDPVTISYLNGNRATVEDDEEASDVIINGRSSRAQRLEEIVQKETRYINFSDCRMRIHSAADSEHSMKIALEYAMVPSSSYSTLNDSSRMNQVAVVNDLDFSSLFNEGAAISDEKVEELMAAMNEPVKSHQEPTKPQDEKEKEPAFPGNGGEFGDELPF